MSPGAPRTYLDLPGASPLAISELMPGTRALMDYTQVMAGEDVLILSEPGVDPLVLQAISAAAAVRDARVHLLVVPPFSPGGADRVGPAPLVTAAWAAADVVIGCTWWAEVHTAQLFFTEVPKHRMRFASLHMTATASALATGARVPLDLLYAITERVLRRCVATQSLRVQTRSGTDVTFHQMRWDTAVGPLGPGQWKPFPIGGANFYPDAADGVLAIEESTVTGVPEEPTFVHLANGVVSEIEGATDARALRAYSVHGYYLRHAFIGVNPRVRLAGAPQFEREKHAGAFYLGLDALNAAGQPDRSGPGFAHCDCQFDRPTITLDDGPLVVDGHLLVLDEPGIRDVAARFADPESLLDDSLVHQFG